MAYTSALRRNLDELRDTAEQAAGQREVHKASASVKAELEQQPSVVKAGSVAFRNLSKIYQSSAGAVPALQDIDLDIEPGSIFGIIGRSGAGKSSLLRTINRLETIDDGVILIDGQKLPARPLFGELLPASAWPKHEVMMVLDGKKLTHKITERRWELHDLVTHQVSIVTIQERIQQKITSALSPVHLDVENETGCGIVP